MKTMAYAALPLVALSVSAAAQGAWPVIALPQETKPFELGGQISVNGMPMRMQGFVSGADPGRLAAWFRQSLGQPLVESALGPKIILGRLQGEYYVTVQLEPAASGTRGLIGMTDLKAAHANERATQAARARWLARLPSGSRLLSQMESDDAGKHGTHLVIVNQHGAQLNRDQLTSLMGDDGMALERAVGAGELAGALAGAPAGAPWRAPPANGTTLFYKGGGKEAMAVISRDASGQTTIVLNTGTRSERAK